VASFAGLLESTVLSAANVVATQTAYLQPGSLEKDEKRMTRQGEKPDMHVWILGLLLSYSMKKY
jgi:hypothetical protein